MRTIPLTVLVLSLLACGGLGLPDAPVDLPATIPEIPVTPGIEVTPDVAAEPVAAPCPEDVVVYPTWEGEWPGPVVNVTAAVAVKARVGACDPAPAVDCTVPVGLYHPWPGAVRTEYATVNRIERWEAITDTTLESRPVRAGQVVKITGYAGEGFCALELDGAELTDSCPEMSEGTTWRRVGAESGPGLVLFRVACAEGRSAFVQVDEAFMALPGVDEGTFPEYGRVAP